MKIRSNEYVFNFYTMLRNKKIISLIFIFLTLLFFSLIGFYSDREWGGIYIFVKHRPMFKLFFASPIGEADPTDIPGKEGYLSSEGKEEENLFIEFVEENKGYERSFRLF